MKTLLSAIFILASIGIYAQNSCNSAQNICNGLPVPFQLTIGPSPSPVVPPAGSFSNPSSNPAGMNAGCLLAGELNPNWFVLNVTSTGPLEFQIGAPGGSGYYDWELWPYNPATGCNGIQTNSVAPAACNWNASAQGFTGMSNSGPPPGGISGNFQPSIPVVAGTAYILMFSNYSSQSGNVNLTFPATGATIGCSGGTPDQTICLGDAANVTLLVSPGWIAATFNWLVTTNVSDPAGSVNVQVSPPVTTFYQVEVWDQGAPVDTIEFTVNVVNPPTPYAGPDQTLCLGDPIQLAGVNSDPVDNSIIWSVDVSAVVPPPFLTIFPNISNPNAVVTANQQGTYEFILQETNATCGMEADTMVVNITDLTISATMVSPSCAGVADGQIQITAAGAIEYSYDGGTTWVPNSLITNATTGVYSVCARNAMGCEKCVNITVTTPPPMTITASNDTLICENGTALLSASATGGTSFSYHWNFTASTASTQSVSPGAATTYTVYAENQSGCVSPTETINVTVRAPLSGTITPNDTICPGYPTDITATVGGGLGQPYMFVWNSGQTQVGVPTHTFSVNPPVTTGYTVTVTDGCESTPLVMTTNVRVAPLPVPAVNVLNPNQCEPAIFDIVNMTDPTLSEYTYWLVNGVQQFINQDTITTDELWAGQYDVQLIVTSYEGCVDSLTFTDLLNVDPKPVADFKYVPNPVLMFNTQVRFTNYSFNGYTYEWFFEDGMPSQSTLTNVDVLFPDGVEGRYDVTLITTSELGCTDTMYHELIVYPEVLIYAPNSFTPDGDEHNQQWLVHMEGIDVYDFELLIYNRWGEVVWESHDVSVGWDGTYGGRHVEPGTYTWIIRTKDLMNDAKYTYEGHVNVLR